MSINAVLKPLFVLLEGLAPGDGLGCWVCHVKDADHCGAYGRDPQRYLQVVQQFLTRQLGQEILRGRVA